MDRLMEDREPEIVLRRDEAADQTRRRPPDAWQERANGAGIEDDVHQCALADRDEEESSACS